MKLNQILLYLKIFNFNRIRQFKQLSQLQGILMAELFKLDIGFHIIEPSAWKVFVELKAGNVKNKEKYSSIRENDV